MAYRIAKVQQRIDDRDARLEGAPKLGIFRIAITGHPCDLNPARGEGRGIEIGARGWPGEVSRGATRRRQGGQPLGRVHRREGRTVQHLGASADQDGNAIAPAECAQQILVQIGEPRMARGMAEQRR